MINMIQNAKDQVLELTQRAYQAAVSAGQLPGDVSVRAGVEIPKDAANGDYTTTFALAAAKAMHKSPREIAGILLEHMDLGGSYSPPPRSPGRGSSTSGWIPRGMPGSSPPWRARGSGTAAPTP